MSHYLNVAILYESIGDIVDTDLVHVGRRGVQVSEETGQLLRSLADKVVWALETASHAVDCGYAKLARTVINTKDDINQLAESINARLVERLIAEDRHRTSTYRAKSQLFENYRRIYYFAKRIEQIVAVVDMEEDDRQPAAIAATRGARPARVGSRTVALSCPAGIDSAV